VLFYEKAFSSCVTNDFAGWKRIFKKVAGDLSLFCGFKVGVSFGFGVRRFKFITNNAWFNK
jgi:hypothetical protein